MGNTVNVEYNKIDTDIVESRDGKKLLSKINDALKAEAISRSKWKNEVATQKARMEQNSSLSGAERTSFITRVNKAIEPYKLKYKEMTTKTNMAMENYDLWAKKQVPKQQTCKELEITKPADRPEGMVKWGAGS